MEHWYKHQRTDDNGFDYIAITEKAGEGNPKWDVARAWEPDHAALIAKAPEMVEALRAVLEIGNRIEGGICHGINPTEYAATIAPMCRAILATIEAKQP